MAEPDNVMGPFWPSNWKTGWIACRYVTVDGTPTKGSVHLSLVAGRGVTEGNDETVTPSVRTLQLMDGQLYGVGAEQNSNGDWVIEFPVTDDPDVSPTENRVRMVEDFEGGSILEFNLPSTATFDNPWWPATDLTATITQPGIRLGSLWLEPVDPLTDTWPAQPSYIRTGDGVIFEDTGRLVRIGA